MSRNKTPTCLDLIFSARRRSIDEGAVGAVNRWFGNHIPGSVRGAGLG
jgi:hypothetical protein